MDFVKSIQCLQTNLSMSVHIVTQVHVQIQIDPLWWMWKYVKKRKHAKRNLKTMSPISRGEREIWIPFPQFREEKEKSYKIFLNFEKRKINFNHLYNFEKRKRTLKFFPFIFREEKMIFLKIERRKKIVQQNLDNRKEKEKFNTKILWTEGRKRNVF